MKSLSTKYLLIATIVIAYYASVLIFTQNFPISDDFALLNFLNKYEKSNSLSDKVNLLFSQHNEHKIVSTKLFFLAYHQIFGNLNFIWLNFIGNLAILGIYITIIVQFIRASNNGTKNNKLFHILLILTCLLFQYGSAESMLWTMASLSNYYTLLFSFISFFFIIKNGVGNFLVAILFATLSTFTQGNGLFVFPIGLLFLFYQKNYKFLCLWAIATAAVSYIYFYNYTLPTAHSSPIQSIKQIYEIVFFTLALLGSTFGTGGSHYPMLTKFFLVPSIVTGISVVGFNIFLGCKGYLKKRSFFFLVNIFLIFTAFAVALSRIDFGYSQALVSRYHINSALILISSFILILQYLDSKEKIIPGSILRGLSFAGIIYTGLTITILYYFAGHVYFPIRSCDIIHPDKSRARYILKESRLNKIYMHNSTLCSKLK